MPGLRERSPSPERVSASEKKKRGGRLLSCVGWNDVWNEVTSVMDKPASLHALVCDAFLESAVLSADSLVSTDRIENLAKSVQSGYNLTPYHNFTHASHVFLSALMLLKEATIVFTRVEKAALLFTAIVHDLEHQGVPNAQLVKEVSPLALQYANKSVAENHSLTAAYAILQLEDPAGSCNVFSDFSREERQRFQSLCSSIILATDIGDKARLDGIYARVAAAVQAHDSMDGGSAGADAGEWYVESSGDGDSSSSSSGSGSGSDQARLLAHLPENRELILILIMKLADVGAPMQQYSTGIDWAERFYNENRTAHKLGRGPPVESDSFVKGQVGFYDFFMKHLIEVAASIGGVKAAVTDDMLRNLLVLKAYWSDKGHAQLGAWERLWDESNGGGL